MTLKRLALVLITVLVAARVLLSLVGSLNEPQVQGRLELYQSNLVLTAAEFDPDSDQVNQSLTQIIGDAPYTNALKQYQAVYDATAQSIQQLRDQATESAVLVNNPQTVQFESAIAQDQQFLHRLALHIGLINAHQQDIEAAQHQWQDIPKTATISDITTTAQILAQLWNESPSDLPAETATIVQDNLDGWFEDEALGRFYQVTQQEEAIAQLTQHRQDRAAQALTRLAAITVLPALGGIAGVGVILFLIGQWVVKRDTALLAQPFASIEVPWDGETTVQGLVVGFFFFSQIVLATALPIVTALLGLNPSGFDLRGKALYILLSYALMTGGGLTILYYTLRPYFPLPEGWFQVKLGGRWALWGVGGYLVAIPLVLLASLLNQQLWQEGGGGNPIILLALQSQDTLALVIFFLTASLAAPLFEEIMFRGFLLPSLTRYLPAWGAIAITSVLFAAAHLSLAEMIPLTVLGAILGVVYWRSRNLLASILLHSLWNSGTLISLFLLGRS
ncbi:CPBP family intramembrane glutamic endopeptidase [Spirulina major]|uniref:CPBP family intramembrane glutamic endopeptidase n=1 Tax=Spirulina major TaxID=270636 RepID=UPI00093278E6|nr:type II CAAX endopeptidase family protein [Spirulina major]